MPNNSLKLIEGGIDFVLLEGEAYRGEKWQDNDNLAQSDKRIKALLEDESFRGDAKEAFIQQMGIGWEGLLMGRMSVGWRSAMENLKLWMTKFMNLMIEWGRACWAARNGIIYRERHQQYAMNRKRLQTEVRVYLNAPNEEALVPIENSRATMKNVRNMPNVEIANWIAGQQQLRQKIQQKKITNIIVLKKREAELQPLDHQFKRRIIEAMGNITTMQQNVVNVVNNNNNNEMDHQSSTPPPEEETTRFRGSGEDSDNSY